MIKMNDVFDRKKKPEAKSIPVIYEPYKFEVGTVVKDLISSFEGVIENRTQWLNNCNTYGVQSTKLKEGNPQETQSFDEPQLELVKSNIHKPSTKTGGPQRKMEKRHD